MEDLPFDSSGHLPLDEDPKYIWATQNLLAHPVELNRADKHMLLRIPGIGLKNADSIIRERSKNKFSRLEELSKFGINLKRASPFLLVNGKRAAYQISYL
jgi:predicted DNA-binding helix-hairpin-helix protein